LHFLRESALMKKLNKHKFGLKSTRESLMDGYGIVKFSLCSVPLASKQDFSI